jgi:cell division transport system permease protein
MSKNSRPTQFYATVSTSIVLVLISLFLLMFFHSSNITNIVKENINILVELEDNLPVGQIEHLKKVLMSQNGIISESIRYVEKNEALKMMSGDMALPSDSQDNPFRDIISFNLRHDAYSEQKIKEVKTQIELEKGISGLYYENESIDVVKSNLEKISFGILILAMCFVVLALAIIFNTVKLTLHADSKLVKTMQMVGAEKNFIKKPYLKSALSIVVKATIAVIVFVGLLSVFLIKSNSVFAEIIQWQYVGLTIVISFISAFIIQFGATNSILNNYLKQSY